MEDGEIMKTKKATKKVRFIEKLVALTQDEKTKAIDFFTKYPLYEKYIDWNNKYLFYADFTKIFDMANTSKRQLKKEAKVNPEVLFHRYNCKIICHTEDYSIIVPFDWEAAVFFNSFQCGGEGAMWCIGDKNTSEHWDNYFSKGNVFFLIYFIKKHPVFGRKIIARFYIKNREFCFYQQNDDPILLSDLIVYSYNNIIFNPEFYQSWYYFRYFEKETINQLFFYLDIFENCSISDETLKNTDIIFSIFDVLKHAIIDSNDLVQKIKPSTKENIFKMVEFFGVDEIDHKNLMESLFNLINENKIQYGFTTVFCQRVMEVATMIYANGYKNDKERIMETINSLDKEYVQVQHEGKNGI